MLNMAKYVCMSKYDMIQKQGHFDKLKVINKTSLIRSQRDNIFVFIHDNYSNKVCSVYRPIHFLNFVTEENPYKILPLWYFSFYISLIMVYLVKHVKGRSIL
jgi:hypothetical protein